MSKKKNKFEDDIYLDAAIRKNELEGQAGLSEAKAEIEKEEPEKKKKGKFLLILAFLWENAPKIAETIGLFKKKKS